MQPRAQLDSVLRRAVDAVEVPGVVAMAATDKGLFSIPATGSIRRSASPGQAEQRDTVDHAPFNAS
jgi:hypothetical protein